MVFCSKCGKRLEANDKFCQVCDTKTKFSGSPESRSDKPKKRIGLSILIGLGLGVIILILFAVFTGKSGTFSSNNNINYQSENKYSEPSQTKEPKVVNEKPEIVESIYPGTSYQLTDQCVINGNVVSCTVTIESPTRVWCGQSSNERVYQYMRVLSYPDQHELCEASQVLGELQPKIPKTIVLSCSIGDYKGKLLINHIEGGCK